MNSVYNLSIFLFLIFIIPSSLSDYKNLDFVKNYEFAEMKINFETKNGAEAVRIRNPVSMELRAYGKNFQIFLQEDNSIASPFTKVTVLGEETTEMNLKNVPGASIYEGIVEGVQQSKVNGYFNQNGFVGRMDLKDEVYYLEMASKYMYKEEYKNKTIIYKQKDVISRKFKQWNSNEIIFDRKIIEEKIKENRSEFLQNDELKLTTKLTCKLELMADHTFVEYMKGNRAQIIAEMLYHIKIVDKIFSYLNLDDDITPEGLGFTVENIAIVENKYARNYPLNKQFSDINHIMNEITNSYKQTWCLLIIFCHRDFDGVIGGAFEGGICLGSKNENIPSNNIALVTTSLFNQPLSRMNVGLILTHQVGHSFGSKHDPFSDSVCSPGMVNSTVGHYIMHPQILQSLSDGSRFNNWKFSLCSVKYINVRLTRSHCLTSSNSECGNGITEFGEECDCGSIESCRELDPCCNPPGSSKGCTLKRHTVGFCSPRENACCTQNCSILPKTENRKCFVLNNPCQINTATCDGKSPFCPGIPLPDGTPCMGYMKSCQFGHCIRNICQDNGLRPCKCEIHHECQICCIDFNGKCKTTSQLNFKPLKGNFYSRIPGTLCNKDKGICSRNGKCSRPRSRQESSYEPDFEDQNRNRWRYYIIIPLGLLIALITILFIFSYFREKKKELA